MTAKPEIPDELWVYRTIGGVVFHGSRHKMPGDILYRRADSPSPATVEKVLNAAKTVIYEYCEAPVRDWAAKSLAMEGLKQALAAHEAEGEG